MLMGASPVYGNDSYRQDSAPRPSGGVPTTWLRDFVTSLVSGQPFGLAVRSRFGASRPVSLRPGLQLRLGTFRPCAGEMRGLAGRASGSPPLPVSRIAPLLGWPFGWCRRSGADLRSGPLWGSANNMRGDFSATPVGPASLKKLSDLQRCVSLLRSACRSSR